jgi:hypothetical protein
MEPSVSEKDISEASEKVKEYAEITKAIKITQEKLKVLTKRKSELHKEVIPKLKTCNISKCNLPFGTLKLITSNRKLPPTKKNIQEKYEYFFKTRAKESDFTNGNNIQKAAIMYNYIYNECAEKIQTNSLSIVYNKEFKEEMKNL